MVILGVDVAVDEAGCRLAVCSAQSTQEGHLALLRWATRFEVRRWAVEDCRHLARNLERDPPVRRRADRRVPPKLMANARGAARTYGKTDPIDALAVARAGRARTAGRPSGRPRP